MAKQSKPRAGSLQFWPRKRARKFLPSVNWKAVSYSGSIPKILGFIGYKVGMSSAMIKDLTENSLTKDKRIIIPVSVLELPPIKIFSVRFYRKNNLITEILAENIDKEMKKKVKLSKKKFDVKKIDEIKDYDDVRIIIYSQVKNTGIKKTPDLAEIALSGTTKDKIKFIKESLGKEISASEIFKDINLLDIRGLTKGKGFQGPVKRFGVKLRQHKSEKGRRRPGSLGPWHPAHTTFRAPMAGQLGMFSRLQYNYKIIDLGKVNENINPKQGWKNFGNIKTEYIILQGSVPGPSKRQLLLTLPLRATKKQLKKQYEFVGLV